MTSLETILVLLVVLLFVAVCFYWLRSRESSIVRTIKQISSEYQRHLVIPDGLDGHIELDYLLLTSHGLVVLDYRDIKGTVFPGEQLQLWSVLQDGYRFSIQNPFETMRHRLNAVRALIKDVPVFGVVVFPDDAEFGNQAPENVMQESNLIERFAVSNADDRELLTKAFHQQYKYVSSLINPGI